MVSLEIINGIKLYHGDSRDLMKALPDNSIDSVVTDPPYALVSIVKRFGGENAAPAKGNDAYQRASAGFMGKTWDTGETAFAVEFWAEVLRVLKPGGHVIAASGTRTYHRLAVAIEDAGFEIRDMISWLYGSGFPKSHDVSKGIDKKRDDSAEIERVRHWLEARRKESGLTRKAVNEALGLAGNGGGLMSSWTTNKTTACIPQWEQWLALKSMLGFGDEMDADVARLNERKGEWGEAAKERGTIETTGGLHGGSGDTVGAFTGRQLAPNPVLEEAKRWQGWGTALKPACEPWVLARKPLSGTVAANVLAHGTGALNIDGCRVGDSHPIMAKTTAGEGRGAVGVINEGRWPANVIHDGSDEVVGAFPNAPGQQGDLKAHGVCRQTPNGIFGGMRPALDHPARNDSGSAARFFYSAKADALDRIGSKHPTVKPVDLMQYLCRLVTPPGGVVLDPFAGSGTTGEAAWREGFRAILIEREADYVADIRRRLETMDASPDRRKAVATRKKASAMPLFGEAIA